MGGISRKRLISRMLDPESQFIYIIGQRGSGRDALLAEFSDGATPASFALFRNWDVATEQARAAFLTHLDRPPKGRRIVVTAESPLVEHPFVSMPPELQCIIQDADLAYDFDEVSSLLSGCGGSADFAPFVLAATGGHVGAVRFIRRLLRNEGERAARALSSPFYLSLHEFVRTAMLAALSTEESAVLLTVVAIGQEASVSAVQAALPWANVDRAFDSLHKRRFINYDPDGIDVIPFIEIAVRERCSGDVRGFARSTIVDLQIRGEHAAAARAAINVGATDDAAESLLQLSTSELLSWDRGIEDVVSALPDALVTSDPRLWIAGIRRRRAVIDSFVLVQEGETLLAVLDERADPLLAKAFRGCLASIYAENGFAARADELFSQAEASDGALTLDAGDIMVYAVHAGQLIRTGDLERGAAMLRRLTAASVVSSWATKMTNIFNIQRCNIAGDWNAEKAFHKRQIDFARLRRDRWWLAESLIEFSYSAAINGDRETLEHARSELRKLNELHLMGPYAAFSSIAGRPVDVEQQRFGLPRLRAMMHFIEGYYSGSADEAAVRFAAAAAELESTRFHPMRIAINVALSQVVRSRAVELLDHAAILADELSWSSMRSAISHLAIGELPARGQPLRGLVAHLRTLTAGTTSADLTLNIISGTVSCGERTLNVSRKVYDLLVALAVRGRAVEREELCEMIWPDDDPQSAANALKMTVRRARLQCGDPNVVVFSSNSYSIGSHVGIDIKVLRAEFELALKEPQEFERLRGSLIGYYERLASGSPTHLAQYEWFVGTNATLQNLQIELGCLLARDALARNDMETARTIVPPMLHSDPCDELAWELVIRGHLSTGDFAAARRAAEEYALLAERSGCIVSDALVNLARREIA